MIYFKFYKLPITGDESLQKSKNGLLRRIIRKINNIFLSNPDFETKLQEVVQWYLEYDEENNESLREIGLDSNNRIIVKMPDKRNYGFWNDTNLTIEDFENRFGIQKVTEKEFNNLWDSVCYDYIQGKLAQGGLSVAGGCRCLTKDGNTSIEKEGYIPYPLQA